MLGAIAEGGGDLTVVVDVNVESTLEFVLLFVSIQLLFVELSQPSSAKTIRTKKIENNTTKKTKVFLMLLPIRKC
jgi:hypothetical protein